MISILTQCEECCVCPEPIFKVVPTITTSCVSLTGEPEFTGGENVANLTEFDPQGGCDRTVVRSVTRTIPASGPATDSGTATTTFGNPACGSGGTVSETYANTIAAFFSYGGSWGAWTGSVPGVYTRTMTVNYGPDANGITASGTATETENYEMPGDSEVGTGCCSIKGSDVFGETTTSTVTVSIEGEPETTYTITLRFSSTCGDDTFESVDITTDTDGIGEVEVEVPLPDLSCSICFEEATSDLYTFIFKIPKIGYGDCYKITWVEMTDGTPVAKEWEWDGTVPPDYDPDDQSTWPNAGVYTLPSPDTTIEDVVSECTGCA